MREVDTFEMNVRGMLTENAPLGAQSWFGCGGSADLLFQPADMEDLLTFLQTRPAGEPLLFIGGLANTIVRDGGVRGCVIQPGKSLSLVEAAGDHRIRAEAGALNGTVAAAAVKAGIGGLEFLSGIPGSVGGALRMNAGAYGTEVKDVLESCAVITPDRKLERLTPDQMGFGYRSCALPDGYIFVGATFKGRPEDPDQVRVRLKDIKARRNDTQPIKEKTGGSTFANPSADELEKAGLPTGMKAWELVDKVGGRGFQIGGAQISEKHCNFMINTGSATAADLENLGEEMISRVQDQFGLTLKWEIKRIGEKA